MSQPKIGAGHLAAWMRAGGKEAAQTLVAFPSHAIQPVEEPGLVGNATQLEVNQEKGNSAMAYEQWLDSQTRSLSERATPTADYGRER
jgi:hypothetical protein